MSEVKRSVVISVVVTAVAAIILTITGYRLIRDVDALIDRAQVAADREDMTEYLEKLRENMEYWGMTEGHFALIFKTPANDLALHYKTVNRLVERLEGIKSIPKNETAYQVALDDIRGTIRELQNPALHFLRVEYWYVWTCGLLIWLFPVVVLKKEDDRYSWKG